MRKTSTQLFGKFISINLAAFSKSQRRYPAGTLLLCSVASAAYYYNNNVESKKYKPTSKLVDVNGTQIEVIQFPAVNMPEVPFGPKTEQEANKWKNLNLSGFTIDSVGNWSRPGGLFKDKSECEKSQEVKNREDAFPSETSPRRLRPMNLSYDPRLNETVLGNKPKFEEWDLLSGYKYYKKIGMFKFDEPVKNKLTLDELVEGCRLVD